MKTYTLQHPLTDPKPGDFTTITIREPRAPDINHAIDKTGDNIHAISRHLAARLVNIGPSDIARLHGADWMGIIAVAASFLAPDPAAQDPAQSPAPKTSNVSI